jgi:hypothetical protein
VARAPRNTNPEETGHASRNRPALKGNAVKHFLGGDGLSFQFSQFVYFIPA